MKKKLLLFSFFLFSFAIRAQFTVTISQPVSNLCSQDCFAQLKANVTGGVGPFTYSWNTSPVQTTQIAVNLCSGGYQVTVTDVGQGNASLQTGGSVPIILAVNISIFPLPQACAGTACNGSTKATATNGTEAGAYDFLWAPGGETTATISGLCTGNTYTVTAKDDNNCSSSLSVPIIVNPLPVISISGNSTICSGNSTSLTASSTNTGTSYTWAPNTGLNQTTGSTVNAFPTVTTTYTVTGTDSKTCTGIAVTRTITVNNVPNVFVDPGLAIICTGTSRNIVASGNAVSYSWSPSTGLNTTTGGTVNSTPTINTTYTVTGTNACGNTTKTSSISLTASPTVTVTPSGAICIHDTKGLTAGNATTFSWLPSTFLNQTTGSIVTTTPTTTTTYTVTGISGSCTGTATVTVTVNPIPTVTATAGLTTICTGSSTSVTASGGTTYTWSPSTGLNQTTGSIVNANPTVNTTYTVVGTSLGCSSSSTVAININPLPTLSLTGNSIVCSGGPAILTAGGAATFTWSPAASLNTSTGFSVIASPTTATTYSVTGLLNGCSSSGTTTVTTTVLPNVTISPTTTIICPGTSTPPLTADGADTYAWSPSASLNISTGQSVIATPGATQTYTVTGTISGVGGCSNTATVTVTLDAIPTLTISPASSICAAGSSTLTVSGASNYTWSPSATLNVSTESSVIASPSGTTTYSVIGTSATGCTSTSTSLVTVIATPTVILSPNTTICTGFPATLTAGGATSYTWTPATGLSATDVASVSANPSVFTTYTVVGSTSGCSSSSKTVSVDAASAIITSAGSDAAICNGGSTPLNATNGTNYTWSPGNGLSCTNCQSPNASPTVTTTYTVTATSGSCVDQDDITVTVNAVPTVIVSGNSTRCAGTPVNLIASGADTYIWSPSTFLGSTVGASVNSSPTTSITYTVTGTNTASGCNSKANSTITVNSLPTVTISANTPICPGDSQRLTASGGTGFIWSPSSSLDQPTGSIVFASPTITQTYTVTVTDVNSCTNTNTTTVTLYVPPTVTTSVNTSICTGKSSNLSASGAGGTNFTWSPNTALNTTTGISVTASPTIVGDNIYTVTGTDGHNCTNTAAVTVTVFSLPAMSESADTPICSGSSTTLSATKGTIISYIWSPASTLSASTGSSVIASPLSFVTYTVIGTDGNGCQTSRSIDVLVNSLPTLTASSNPTIVCSGTPTTLSVGGGDNYSWSPAGSLSAPTGSIVSALPPSTTTYSVTGTYTITGCSSTTTVDITVIALPTVIVSPNKTICAGEQTPLTVGGSGGLSYTWSPATSLDVSTGSSVSAIPTATRTYIVNGDNGICSQNSSVTITVNALPTVSFSGLSPSYCTTSPDVTIISGNHDGDLPPGSFVPSTAYMVANVFKPIVAGAGTFIIKYGYTDPTGCTDTASFTTVIGNQLAVSLTPSGSTTFCSGDSVILDAGLYASWVWSPSGATTQKITLNTTVSGDYNINVTVSQGGLCTGSLATDSIIMVNPVPTLTVTSNLTACAGSLSILNAIGGSSYLWTPSTALNITIGKTVFASPTSTTTYTVTGSDGTCSSIDSVKITTTALPTVSFVGLAASYCTSPGDITLIGNHSADLTPGTFLQTANVTGNTFNPGGVDGVFTVKYGYTSSGCTDTSIQTTVISPTLSVNITPSGATTFCQGGTVILSPGAYTNYHWSNGAITPSINVNSTGTYSVTVDNGTACSGFSEISITVNPLPVVSFGGLAESYCNVLPTATLIPNPLGGTFSGVGMAGSIFDPTNSSIVYNIPFSIKYVYTDANSCTDSISKNVIVDTQLHPSVSPSPSASFCQGNAIVLDAGTYATGYTYNWSTFATTQTINTNTTNTISVTISNGAGCSGTSAPFTPTVNALPTVTFSGLAPSYCAGSADDPLTGIPSGGTFSAIAGITGNTFSPSGVPVGSSYDITYTSLADANGCVGSSTQTTIVNTNLSPVITVTGSTTFCAGGSVNLESDFGYDTYSWSNSSTIKAIDAQLTGDYNVTVTLGNNCLGFSPSTHITVNPLPIVSIDNLASTYCPGSPIANIILSPSGVGGVLTGHGINALTNTFDPADASITLGTSFPVKYVFTNNPSGCKDSVVQNVTVNATLAATINTIGNAIFCDKDSVILDAGAGYTNYTWSPGGQTTTQITVKTQNTYSVTVENGSPSCSANASKAITVNPLPIVSFDTLFSSYCISSPPSILTGIGNPAGGTGSFFGTGISGNTFTPGTIGTHTISYSYTITATGCSNMASQVTEVGLNISPSISPTGSITLCQGSTATLDPGVYETYLWSTGATTQTINVPSVNAVPAVTVTNGAGCPPGIAFKVISEISSPTITVLSDNATICSGSSANLTAGGSSISYQWSPFIGLSNSTGSALTASPNSPTTYSVTGTDINNCSITTTIDIAVNTLPTAPIISTGGATTFCAGDSVTVDAGTGYAAYLWLPSGETTQSISAKINATYSVQGFNSNNCAATTTIDISVNPSPTVTISPGTSICLGGSTLLTADGGGTYSWTPVSGLSSATDAITTSSPVSPTSYTLTVTNTGNGCTDIKTVDVFVSSIALSSSITKPSLCSSTNGAIDLTVGSGISPYNFSWSNAAITEDLSSIGGGTFSVTVTDKVNCQGMTTVTVTPITPVVAKAGNDTVICKENSFTLNSNKSTGANSYQWFKVPDLIAIGNDTTLVINPDDGTSTFILKAISGICTSEDTIIIKSNPIVVDAGSNVTFYVGNSASIGGNPTTSVSGTTIRWMPHFGLSDSTASNPIASPTITTTYYVTVTNSGNCSVTDSVLFEIIPEVISTGGLSPNGDGLNDSWVIENIELYPNCLVEVYNRWGELLFSSPGYVDKWDATFNGKKLPVGTYYYIINLNDPVFPKPLTGPITILR